MVFAFFSGCIVILTMVMNSRLAMKIGVFQGTFINYVVGFLFSILVLLINYKNVSLSVKTLSYIPFWAYLGGLMGVVVVSISNIVIPKIGAIYSTLLIFIGQLFTGIVIDFFIGSFISKGKIIGGLLILGGMVYNSHVDKKYLTEGTINEQIS